MENKFPRDSVRGTRDIARRVYQLDRPLNEEGEKEKEKEVGKRNDKRTD